MELKYLDTSGAGRVGEYCEGCVYLARLGDNEPWCDYIGVTERCRPCPAGDGCTEKIAAGRKKGGNQHGREGP